MVTELTGTTFKTCIALESSDIEILIINPIINLCKSSLRIEMFRLTSYCF